MYKTKSDFDKIYFDKIKPIINKVELKRIKYLNIINYGSFVIWLFFVPLLYYILKKICMQYNSIYIGLFLQIALILIIKSFYKIDIKEKIFNLLIYSVEDLEYSTKYNVDRELIENSEIAPVFDFINTSDHLSGKYKSHAFSFYKLNLKAVTNKKILDVFKGYALEISLKQTLKSVTIIRPKILFQINLDVLTGKKEVVLEDPNFNKYFKVMSTDQIEARKILSAKAMEKINNLSKLIQKQSLDSQKKYKGDLAEFIKYKLAKLSEPVIKPSRFSCVFQNDSMLMLIPTDYKFFECAKLNVPVTKKLYDAFVDDLLAVYEIIDSLIS